jgi:2-hydroxychromene-2-carboxylate isomerase
MTSTADWYFDFISPFAYLQFKHFDRLPPSLEVRLQPLLFAGLLGHWAHKGPAEIPAKRIQTYRYCHWYAARLGVPFRTPPAHPFNPLKVLRLAIALDATPRAVGTIFNYIWGEGGDVHSDEGFAKLCDRLQLDDASSMISASPVKTALRENTARAIAAGVYGIPTFAIDGELFWGFDLTDMLLEFLADPSMMRRGEMQRLARLPKAAERKT